MIRSIQILFMLICLISCDYKPNNQVNQSQQKEENIDKRTNIEKFYTDFRARHKNGMNNDVLKEKMNKELKQELLDTLTKSSELLSDFPIQLDDMKSNYRDKNSCFVHFQSWLNPEGFQFEDYSLHQIQFDIVGKAPIKYADILKEEDYYYVYGKLKRFITLNEFSQYTNGMAYTPIIGLDKEVYDDVYNLQMGLMLFEIDSIVNSEYRKRF
mgnify:CR=1 FL=1